MRLLFPPLLLLLILLIYFSFFVVNESVSECEWVCMGINIPFEWHKWYLNIEIMWEITLNTNDKLYVQQYTSIGFCSFVWFDLIWFGLLFGFLFQNLFHRSFDVILEGGIFIGNGMMFVAI